MIANGYADTATKADTASLKELSRRLDVLEQKVGIVK